ncbi:MAG: ribonuclease Z [Pseudopedobacter saltans]|uniref:Ribonuclease Z n=1 Tax=Pseudopedobacter saltans TaxID=151895 RepID=A0A2W5F6D1_9SPHI|nr:MAG: ribonuclease Z [Pseudopedobacter saltans]
MLSVTTLGINSALPAYGRHPTSQVIHLDNLSIMVDCGEGTQMQMLKYKVKRGRLDYIFISHLHGDHYLGLPGLLNSLSLSGRTSELHVYAPAALEEILQLHFKVANTSINFPLHFHALPISEGKLLETNAFQVDTFLTEHRIECHGFVFKEKKNPRSIDAEKVKSYDIPYSFYDQLQMGEDFVQTNGYVVYNKELTLANTPSKSYAFCADTRYIESFIPYVQGVDMLYHEATYLDDLQEKAYERYHSTSKQAATLALKADVKRLLIGHFSSKYEYLDMFLEEAKSVFSNTEIAKEGFTFDV